MMSWAARFQLRQHLRQSLWAVPLVGTVAGAALATVDLALEDAFTLPSGWTYSASAAGSLLSAVAGAMIGLLGLVVTIGVLVVQMATGTLSPRFMRLWYRDRLQKVVLASFTATFAFAFVLLREIGSGTVPNLGVTLAGLAVIVDLILLLLYLDRFVHALRPVAVAAAMASAGLAVVEEMAQSTSHHAPDDWVTDDADLQVRSRAAGAIQAIAVSKMMHYARAHDLVCVLPYAVGDFVNQGDVLFEVNGQAPQDAARRLQGMVALGHERTIEQDPAFAVRIIVDIAIRALSPAVNDPTTATQMINHLGTLLAGVGQPRPEPAGSAGRLLRRTQDRAPHEKLDQLPGARRVRDPAVRRWLGADQPAPPIHAAGSRGNGPASQPCGGGPPDQPSRRGRRTCDPCG